MTNSPHNSAVPDPAALSEAAEWFDRVHAEEARSEDLDAWQRWIARSNCNQLAFRTVEDAWHRAGAAPGLKWPTARELAEDQHASDTPVADWLATRGRAMATGPAPRIQRRVRRFAASLGAAGVVAALLGWYGWTTFARPDFAVVETGPRQHRELSLPDGSGLVVGARSLVTVNYSEAARYVVLDSGEAFFSVEPDPSRPFVVRAGSGTITAVGTAFNVQHIQGRVVVTVVSGTVDVASRAPAVGSGRPPRSVARVKAGEEVAYGSEPTQVSPADTGAVLGWQVGRLEYPGESLKFVVPDVSRYTDKQIVIADPAVGEMHFTGTVFQNQVDDWLASLPDVFPIDLVYSDEDTVLLKLRASGTEAGDAHPVR